jgi:hypothetical protein
MLFHIARYTGISARNPRLRQATSELPLTSETSARFERPSPRPGIGHPEVRNWTLLAARRLFLGPHRSSFRRLFRYFELRKVG